MAVGTKNGKGATKDKPGFADFRFVNSRLTKAESEDFARWWKEHADDAFTLLNEMVGSGYKFSATWDDSNACFIASLTCVESKSPNYCLILSSRSDDLWEAIGLSLFKNYALFPGGEWPTDVKQNWG